MKIGIDIDGVILDTENVFRVKAELYDLLVLHKSGQVNNLLWAQLRYDWTQEELKEYQERYLREASKEANLKPGAKEVLQMLKEEGHELIIITARGGFYDEMQTIVEERFKKEELIFDKYYWKSSEKLEIALKEKIDIMIDDRDDICEEMAKHQIKTLHFRDVNRKKIEETEYVTEVNTWGEVYRKIYQYQ